MRQAIIDLGLWLTRIGERYEIRPLIYNPLTWGHFFVSARRGGVSFAAAVRECYPEVGSALDVGAGTGGYVFRMKQAGIPTKGMEYSSVGRGLARVQGVTLSPFDCSQPSGVPDLGRFDLAYSIEVGEHLPDSLANSFVESIANTSDFVIFSAAFPGQGGHGHINEQPKEYWREKFVQRGFEYCDEETTRFSQKVKDFGYRGWLPQNLQVLRRKKA